MAKKPNEYKKYFQIKRAIRENKELKCFDKKVEKIDLSDLHTFAGVTRISIWYEDEPDNVYADINDIVIK